MWDKVARGHEFGSTPHRKRISIVSLIPFDGKLLIVVVVVSKWCMRIGLCLSFYVWRETKLPNIHHLRLRLSLVYFAFFLLLDFLSVLILSSGRVTGDDNIRDYFRLWRFQCEHIFRNFNQLIRHWASEQVSDPVNEKTEEWEKQAQCKGALQYRWAE